MARMGSGVLRHAQATGRYYDKAPDGAGEEYAVCLSNEA